MSLEINNTLLNNNNEIIERIKTKASQININNSSEGVKLFATIDEMNADTAKEGDLAVVYSQDVSSMTATTETQTITFPRTVVLPEAFIDSIYTMLRAVDESMWADAQAILESSMFNFDFYGESINVSVQYESSDGITYTRIDGGAETIDLGTPIKCYYEEEWNDTLGYFMQVPSMYFGGLFKYNTQYDNPDYSTFIEEMSYPDFIESGSNYYTKTYVETLSKYMLDNNISVYWPCLAVINSSTNNIPNSISLYYIDGSDFNIEFVYDVATGKTYITTWDNYLSSDKPYMQSGVIHRLDWDSTTNKIISTDIQKGDYICSYASRYGITNCTHKSYIYAELPNAPFLPCTLSSLNSPYLIGNYFHIVIKNTDGTATRDGKTARIDKILEGKYELAPTQLDATADYVYEKEFYGPNGVETGSLQETTQLTLKDLQLKSEIYNTLNHLIAPENMQNAFNSYTGASLDVSNIDIANTTNLQGAFQNMDNLVELDLTKWDTSNIKNMYYTFTNNDKLERLLLGDTFTTQNVVTIGGAFSNNPLLQELDLHNMTLNKTTNIDYLFWKCTSLRKLDISKCDFTNITSYKDTFTNIPTDCLILVKDQAAKDWVLARRSDLTNVQIAN